MTKNQLPEGVGKKIVEALKRQSEIEINPVEEDVQILSAETEAEQNFDLNLDAEESSVLDSAPNDLEVFEDVISNEVNDNILAQDISVQDNFAFNEVAPSVQAQETPSFSFDYQQAAQTIQPSMQPSMKINMQQNTLNSMNSLNNNISYQAPKEVNMSNPEKNTQVDVPANVAVLKRLISQLPAGVTKQTGAQIIRQTIEALGISMNNVLQEAQQVQDELNGSIKDCMTKVQEYKTNIMYLERHAQDYQRQVAQLNDLISLFILTDKMK